jgi:hypothetical protein
MNFAKRRSERSNETHFQAFKIDGEEDKVAGMHPSLKHMMAFAGPLNQEDGAKDPSS